MQENQGFVMCYYQMNRSTKILPGCDTPVDHIEIIRKFQSLIPTGEK